MDELIERGSYYHTSFFQIFLQGKYNQDLSQLSSKDLGLFVHEYIHYIQNIGTLWGIYSALHEYKRVSDVLLQLIDKEEINIVYTPTYSEDYLLRHEIWSLGEGFDSFGDLAVKSLDHSKEVELQCENIDVQGRTYKQYLLTFYFTDSSKATIPLGAKIIRESMAYLCQSLFDIDYELKSEFPYKIVDYLCEAKFKNIAGDTKKIIAICYISLFSMRPAEVLVDYLFMANNNLDIDYWGLFDIFLSCNIENNGVDYSIEAFFDKFMDDFQGILKKLTRTDIPFFKYSLDNARITFHEAPLIAVITTDKHPLNYENIQALVDYYGVPYIATSNGLFGK